MTINQTNVGGPFLLAPIDARNTGTGITVTVRGGTAPQGAVRQFMKPGLADAEAAVEYGIDSAEGGLTNVAKVDTSVNSGDDVFACVVTDKETVADDGEARVVVSGRVRVLLLAEASTAYPEYTPIYMVDDQDYVTTNASLAGVGRKCGVLLGDYDSGDLAAGTHLVDVLFVGTPPYLS